MDSQITQAINDLQLTKNTNKDLACWRCCKRYLESERECHNESVFRSINTHFKASNILMFISTTTGFITLRNAFDTTILKSLLNILLDSKMTAEDKEHIINLLNRHSQMHPACSDLLAETFRNLILLPLEENQTDETTIVQKILSQLEKVVLPNTDDVVNTVLSRSLRKKKKSGDFYTEEDFAPKRRRTIVKEDPTEVEEVEVLENNPVFIFGALNFIIDTMVHDFYAKCYSSNDKSILKKTIAGNIFLNFDECKIYLEDKLYDRFFEIFKHCDNSNRGSLIRMIELIADTCLYADSGKLTVCGDIMCNKQYPLSQLFSLYFVQSVLKRTSTTEFKDILKTIKPSWLRLICAISALKRAGFSKGLPTFLEKVSSEVEKYENDASSAITSAKFHTFIEKKIPEEVSLIVSNVISASAETYRLREFEKLCGTYEKKADTITNANIGNYEAAIVREYQYYVQFKKIIGRIIKIDKVPMYINVLQYL